LDSDYPYTDATLGQWGYDHVEDELRSPGTYRDMMSYCGPVWISDYTYGAMYDRNQAVAAQGKWDGEPGTWRAITLDTDGSATLGHTFDMFASPSGERVDLDLFGADGEHLGETTGISTQTSHLGVGLIWVRDLGHDVTSVVPR
jgi:hypothetical protein